MAASPQFVSTPVIGMTQISTVNTGLDGSGTLGDVVTGATNGTRIDKVAVKAADTTTAGMIRLFIDNGTNIRLLEEIEVTAITPSGTVKAWSDDLFFSGGLILPSGYVLKAGTQNAETFNVFAFGGNF